MSIRLLIADTAPLFPPERGGQKRIWNLYSRFGTEFEVTYAGIDCGLGKKRIDRKVGGIREVVRPITRLYYLFRFCEMKASKNAFFDFFVHLCMGLDMGFRQELDSIDADIVIASHPWAAPCLNAGKGRRFIYDAHNCEFTLVSGMLKRGWSRRLALSRVKSIEKEACRKAVAVLAVSSTDKDDLIRLYGIPEEKIHIVPNGTVLRELPSSAAKEAARRTLGLGKETPVVLFIGTYYKPNIEAAGFIIEKLAKSCPEAVFAVVGTVNGSCRDKVPVNVRLAGGVSDELLSEWLAAADIAINPMFSGSGMNMKMLDYFSAGLPVISTRFGLRGIEGEDFRDYLVSSPEDFAEKLRLLMRDPVLRDRLGKNARSLAEEKYDWEKISAGLADLLRGIKDR